MQSNHMVFGCRQSSTPRSKLFLYVLDIRSVCNGLSRSVDNSRSSIFGAEISRSM
jgi:hypothetical protein